MLVQAEWGLITTGAVGVPGVMHAVASMERGASPLTQAATLGFGFGYHLMSSK